MAIDINTILERLQGVDIRGIVDMQRSEVGKEKQPVVEIQFLTLKGALKDDHSLSCKMIVGADDPDERPDDLAFLMMVEECEAYSKKMPVFMDANGSTKYGGYKWNPEDDYIRFKYCLPLPPHETGFPDCVLLQRMLSEMYNAVLFPDVRTMKWSIDSDEMLTDDEKRAKMQRLDGIVESLIGPNNNSEDEGV